MEDSYIHQGQRRKLVEELKSKGIRDEKVLEAINSIPRHLFFDKVFHKNYAYSDLAFPIGAGQTISKPHTVAFQTELLDLEKGMKVLEVGTGSGYQTAVLIKLGAKVYSIERQRELYLKTKKTLPELGYRANFFFGDGYIGKEAFAPFDRIIITCGAPYVPKDLIQQLKEGGKMVIPVGEGDIQVMTLIEKFDENNLKETTFGEFSFVPMLTNKNF